MSRLSTILETRTVKALKPCAGGVVVRGQVQGMNPAAIAGNDPRHGGPAS